MSKLLFILINDILEYNEKSFICKSFSAGMLKFTLYYNLKLIKLTKESIEDIPIL